MYKYSILFFLSTVLIILVPSSFGEPTTKDIQAGIYLIVLDPLTEDTYLVDLKRNLMKFINDPASFDINILEQLNSNRDIPIQDITNFQWSLIGGIDNSFNYIGHIGSYLSNKTPTDIRSWKLRLRIKRLEYLLQAQPFEGENNKFSIRKVGEPGHWDPGWQGSYDGLQDKINDMQGKAGANEMNLFTQFVFEGKFKNKEIKSKEDIIEAPDWENITLHKIGRVKLSGNGILSISIEK